jgi:hypothetical protein
MTHRFTVQQLFRRSAWSIASSWIGLSALATFSLPVRAAESQPASTAMQRLTQMFSPEIQKTLSACHDKGQVNLAAGASSTGSVVCGDGAAQTDVPFQSYVGTISDILTASSLVGLRSVIAKDPRVTPEMLSAFLKSDQGSTVLRSAVEAAITRSGLVATAAPQSASVLTDQVIERLLPTMEQTNNLQTLLGTDNQYRQVVQNFCTSPGMSVQQAQQQVPGLSSVQLYAICIEESGMANEMMQMAH